MTDDARGLGRKVPITPSGQLPIEPEKPLVCIFAAINDARHGTAIVNRGLAEVSKWAETLARDNSAKDALIEAQSATIARLNAEVERMREAARALLGKIEAGSEGQNGPFAIHNFLFLSPEYAALAALAPKEG